MSWVLITLKVSPMTSAPAIQATLRHLLLAGTGAGCSPNTVFSGTRTVPTA